MVKYKNFGTSGQSVGSFSFSSQASQLSTKTTKSIKSKSHHRRNERSPSITRRGSEEDDCRDEDGSRFDPRIVLRDSTEEEDIKEDEVESLYDMISYNGITDEHSTSVCASYSYSAGETVSSDGFSDPQQPTPNSRRSKLSYMGYVPMSPNTAAAMAMKEMREHSDTHRHRNGSRNGSHDVANNNSGHTAGEGTTTTGSTFPSIKVDDTSTSRRRERNYDDESLADEDLRQSASAGTDDCSSQCVADNVTEYVTVGQQKCLEEQKKVQLQNQNRDSTTVTSSSVADQYSRVEDATIATSVESSVMPNSCTGHPAMKMTNQGRFKSSKHEFHPLSPVIASPTSQHPPQTPAKAMTGASTSGQDAWADVSILSPLTAGVSANGMAPPSLNHPPTMMQQQWNPNRGLQQQFGHHQPQPIQYPYGAVGNTQQYPLNQQQHPQQLQHPMQQPQKPFQSGFFPRNPVLARQLQAFHQFHNQQNQQEQPSSSSPPMNNSPRETQASHPTETSPVETPPAETPPAETSPAEKPPIFQKVEPTIQQNEGAVSSQESKGENSNSDHQPFLICGPEGPRLMDNVTFVTPTRNRSSGSKHGSSHSRAYGASYSGGSIGMGCAQNPAGMKCQSYVASLINTCGAIVNHGYHIDNSKSSSKEKRAKFGKVADKSIAGLAPSEHCREEGGGNGIGAIGNIGSGLNDAFAENAKKILHAGNNMMNTLPKDFQNLTQSAAYHNVFDTFQKYASVKSPVQSEDNTGIRSSLSDDPDEVETAKEPKAASLSPISAQREHFKKLRRMRRGPNSPTQASTSEGNPASPISTRYSRNLHTKLHQQKLEKATGAEETRVPEDPEESRGKDPVGSKDDDSHCSWATPMSREESEEENREVVKPDPLPGSESPADSLEEVLGEKATQDVVTSTSSGMSESLVGSDVDDEEPQLDPMMNSSLSDDERQDVAEGEEQMLLNSFDHEFPHTHLDVIEEEGSEDEETTVNPDSPMDEQVVDTTPSDALWADGMGYEKRGFRTSIKSMIGIVRILFAGMLFFQCGTIICMWDQIADQIRTVEGGPEVLASAEGFVSNLRFSGVSLVTTAKDIINVDQIDISMGDIFSEIELRTTEMMGTASKFLAGLVEMERTEADELQLFHQLVDDAFGDDDILQTMVVEEVVSSTV